MITDSHLKDYHRKLNHDVPVQQRGRVSHPEAASKGRNSLNVKLNHKCETFIDVIDGPAP